MRGFMISRIWLKPVGPVSGEVVLLPSTVAEFVHVEDVEIQA